MLLPGCSKKEYDISDGFNREMTLFEDEITLPIGSAGPVTIKDLLDSSPTVAGLFNNLLKEGDDGVFYFESDDAIFSQSAYKLALEIPDPTEPYQWKLGDKSTYVAPLASALRLLGLVCPHQQLIIQGRNPLWSKLGVHTRAHIVCRNNAGDETYTKNVDLSDILLPVSGAPSTIATVEFPEDLVDLVDQITLQKLTLDIPANLKDDILSSDDEHFAFSTRFKSQLALSETFNFSFSIPIHFDLPAAAYWLHRIELSFDLENSLPLDITVVEAHALSKDGQTIPGVVITADKTISGGKPGAPGVTPLVLVVEAKDGIIPDLGGVSLDLQFTATEGIGIVPLSSLMGVSIHSAIAKLDGGVTLFGHE